MALTATEKATIGTELSTDPLTLGYAALIAACSAGEIADILNATDPGGATLPRDFLEAWEIADAQDPTESAALTTAQLLRFGNLMTAHAATPIHKDSGQAVNQIKDIYPTNTTTWANILAVQTIDATRVEALINREYTITHTEVTDILRTELSTC